MGKSKRVIDSDEEEEAEFELEEETERSNKTSNGGTSKRQSGAKRKSTNSSSTKNPKKKKKKNMSKVVESDEEEEEDDDFEKEEDVMEEESEGDFIEEDEDSPVKKTKKKSSASSDKKGKQSATKEKKKKVKVKKEDNGGDDDSSNGRKKKPAAKKKEPKAMKEMTKIESLNHAMQAFLWWNAPPLPDGAQWNTMEHAGVSFPDPYEPHGVKMLYDGEPVDLTTEEEEAATFFAAMDPDGMNLGNAKTAPIFIKNFFADFKKVLGKGHVIKSFDKCDFQPIRDHLNEQKLVRKAATDDEKQRNKDEKDQILFKFGYCIVDGHLEKVGNFNMEPPGTFRGRGEHPKMGKLKSRVMPEGVSLNLSECSRVPICPVPGHAWGDVIHEPKVQWLASWKENINNMGKYMQLSAVSSFKGKSDRAKYSKAARLCGNIGNIRKDYKQKLRSSDNQERQLATAMWVIDRLALRVGGEKDTDEEADTVGCCSLRVEHLKFDPNNEGEGNKEIELEFLGKDSMLFKQTIDFASPLYTDNDGRGVQVYENFKRFSTGKDPMQDVFESLNPTVLNNHLKTIMDGLSAKVFRTYNASKTLQDELRKTEQLRSWESLSVAEKVVEYNSANREVAILCNHQKTVSKAQETQLDKVRSKLDTLKKQKKILKEMLKKLLKDENSKDIPTKKSDAEIKEAVKQKLEDAKLMKEKAKTPEEKIAATKADEEAKEFRKKATEDKFEEAHLWERIPTQEMVAKRIETWNGKIAKMELDLKHKDDNKEVSLGTSKINYMDPRVTVAFCKRNEVPIEKIFSKALRDKFNWAMAVPPDWEFNAEVGKEAD